MGYLHHPKYVSYNVTVWEMGADGDRFVVRLTCWVFAVQFLCKAVPATFFFIIYYSHYYFESKRSQTCKHTQ